MESRGFSAILPAALALLTLLAVPAARAEHVAVLVSPPFSPRDFADRGAVGLLVPGAGSTVTREGALAALRRGRVESSLLGGVPGGRPLISLARRPREVTIHVSLPPPGKHHNVRRYPIAIVGGGYSGLLVSRSTRIPGLATIADVAPTVRALERGDPPPLRSRAAADAPETLERLDRRLTLAHDSRGSATLVLVVGVLTHLLLAVALRSPLFGRAALLAAPAALAGSLALSAAGVTGKWAVTVALALVTGAGSLVAAAALRSRELLGAAFVAILVVYLVVLAAWPEVNSLASIGPHPDGGGRFYGVTNQVSTLLLAPALVAAALLGPRWFLPVAALALVTVGASRTGADGGGAIVLAAGFLVLALRERAVRLKRRRVALAAAGAAGVVLALVALDAASGGSSHVTRAVGEGPLELAEELAHRLHVSAASVVATWHAGALLAFSLAALAWLATRQPRLAVREALLAALAVSLAVNDTPLDVAAFGALSCAALWGWERSAGPRGDAFSTLGDDASPPRAAHPPARLRPLVGGLRRR